ncbi:MAG TPA: hypothetical protein VNH11_03505 [Pirellulales bacterium]|nr:hypothetical protein [Pirellulales bacterium]
MSTLEPILARHPLLQRPRTAILAVARQLRRQRGFQSGILAGYGNFRPDHQETHAQLDDLMIDHVYRDGPKRAHDWHSGWLVETADLLLAAP